jgi:hypothetical protein
MLWAEERTWKSIRQTYGLMKSMKAGFRTQFVQAAYAECFVASRLKNAGYDVRFHEDNCDVSVVHPDSNGNLQKTRFEVKHSEDNKQPDNKGHGFASWLISQSQVDKEKFDLCVLVRDSLKWDEPDAVYVFKRQEIARTKPIEVNPPKKDYYIWYSEYFEDLMKDNPWFCMATNSLVKSLHRTPVPFQKRWNVILKGELRARGS